MSRIRSKRVHGASISRSVLWAADQDNQMWSRRHYYERLCLRRLQRAKHRPADCESWEGLL